MKAAPRFRESAFRDGLGSRPAAKEPSCASDARGQPGRHDSLFDVHCIQFAQEPGDRETVSVMGIGRI